jgi:tetratricopeptide (TPR) repeat protein
MFHKRNFRQAKDLFEKAAVGPSREVAANALSHVRMCERRLAAPPPAPKSLEEHYTYGVALINSRDLGGARSHLDAALKIDPSADHVHYAMAVCRVLSGDLPGAYDSLKRAIELQPRNRRAALQDPDLEDFVSRPPLNALLT